MKVTCKLNKDFSVYRWPMIVEYDRMMFIPSNHVQEYIGDYQKTFQTKIKMELNEKKRALIEKELQQLIEKYRKEGKLFFEDEVDLKPVNNFPRPLLNGQMAIHFLQIKNKNMQDVKF